MTEKKEAGNKAFGTGEYLEAIGYYQEGLKVCPRSRQERAVLYGNTAACQLKLDKFEEAIASCDKGKEPFFFLSAWSRSQLRTFDAALEIDPKYVKILVRRAQAKERKGGLDGLMGSLEGGVGFIFLLV